MKEKNLNEKESLEIITEMIQKTKKHDGLDHGKYMLMWGYLGVCASALELFLLMWTDNLMVMWGWVLVPIVGWALHQKIEYSANANRGEVKTYSDDVSSKLWWILIIVEIVTLAICLLYRLMTGMGNWGLMFVVMLLTVGLVLFIQGCISREKCHIFSGIAGLAGGCLSFAFGNLFIHPIIGTRGVIYSMIFYIVCFTLMLIIPGHILTNKARHTCSKN